MIKEVRYYRGFWSFLLALQMTQLPITVLPGNSLAISFLKSHPKVKVLKLFLAYLFTTICTFVIRHLNNATHLSPPLNQVEITRKVEHAMPQFFPSLLLCGGLPEVFAHLHYTEELCYFHTPADTHIGLPQLSITTASVKDRWR